MATGVCLHCSISFKYTPSQSTGKYCSLKHQQAYQRLERLTAGTATPGMLRQYMIDNVKYVCSACGTLPVWNGKPLTLQLDHVDGDLKNNSISNGRWLCPNCHTQTSTWGVLNVSEDARQRMRSNCKAA